MSFQSTKETRLKTHTGGGLDAAAVKIGEREEDRQYKYCTMVVCPDRNPCKFYLAIPEGFYAVVTNAGQYVGIYPAGLHYALPWERVSHLVTKQYIVFDTPVKECPTLDNVMVEIDVNVVFHIMEEQENVKKFVYTLGPERLQDMLKAFQEEAVRGMARQKNYTDIYDLMDTEELPDFEEKKDAPEELPTEEVGYDNDDDDQATEKPDQKTEAKRKVSVSKEENLAEQLENTKREMNRKLNEYGVNVYSITITNVRLPAEFRNQMEEATTFQSKNIEQESKQRYDLLVIENTEKRNKDIQQLQELKEEAIVKKDQRAAMEKKTTDIFAAETESLLALIKEEMKSEIRDINTISTLKCAQLNAEKVEELAAIEAEAEAEIKTLEAELEGFITKRQAEMKATVAELEAKKNMILAEAENDMKKKLIAKRDFNEKMSNIMVLNRLADNPGAVVSGTIPKDREATIATLLGAKNAAISLGLQ